MSNSGNAAILERVLEPASHKMTADVARWFIGIRADADLQARVDELADKNTAGVITSEELAEYDDYLMAADIVGVLQSKARAVLARTIGN
jgi:hypothetical protein